jgi:hypothetical protein
MNRIVPWRALSGKRAVNRLFILWKCNGDARENEAGSFLLLFEIVIFLLDQEVRNMPLG